jgi:hypothetical protein
MLHFCSFFIVATGDLFVSASWRNSGTFSMISAASVFALPRCPWIPLSSRIGFDASTNYRFQFFVTPKSEWSVLGGSSTPKKEAESPSLQLFCSDAIAASDRS